MKLDTKIFIITFLLIPTAMVFKLFEDTSFLLVWYLFFLMTSIVISGFHMGYMWSSKYNRFRNVGGSRDTIITIIIYILVCIGVSFIITKFELFWIYFGF